MLLSNLLIPPKLPLVAIAVFLERALSLFDSRLIFASSPRQHSDYNMQRTLLLARSSLRTVSRPFSTSALRPSETPAPAPQLLSYFVARTASGELPVYSDVKSGGQRLNTLVRKVDGNIEVRLLSLLSSATRKAHSLLTGPSKRSRYLPRRRPILHQASVASNRAERRLDQGGEGVVEQ